MDQRGNETYSEMNDIVPEKRELFSRVHDCCRHWTPERVDHCLYDSAQYGRIFRSVQSFKGVHDGQIREPDSEIRYICQHVQVRLSPPGITDRFIYNATAKKSALGFVVHPDAQEDAINALIRQLVNSFLIQREIEAADLFNHARLYDPMIGGDGVPMCSTHHPYENGTWANTFSEYQSLSPLSFESAVSAITKTFVDDGGIKIVARPEYLIVPPSLAPEAQKIARLNANIPGFKGCFVWDYLSDEGSWFVTTSCEGLYLFESKPFALTISIDEETKNPVVTGEDVRALTYTDPRAVFGSVKNVSKRSVISEHPAALSA